MRRQRARSSRHSTMVYALVISIWKSSNSAMKVAIRVSDWRPLPPTPTSSALPKGSRMMREMRTMCSHAYRKSTRSIGDLEVAL